jgi:hypothetical protein
VLSDEDAAAVWFRQYAARIEGQPERRSMIAECVIGDDRLGLLRIRRHSRIHVLSVIAERPTIKAAIFHRRHVIRHEIAAELIALVDCCPQRARLRLPVHAVGIAKARGKYSPLTGGRIDLEDRRAVFLLVEAVLSDIAVGADRGVEPRSIAACNHVLRPVMIDWPSRQVGNFDAGIGDPRHTLGIGEAYDGVGIGDVEIVTNEGHAERRVQALEKNRLGRGAGPTCVP